MARFDLTDEEWAVISPLSPAQGRGARRGDDRKVLNGIFYILRTGAPWRDLPERYEQMIIADCLSQVGLRMDEASSCGRIMQAPCVLQRQ